MDDYDVSALQLLGGKTVKATSAVKLHLELRKAFIELLNRSRGDFLAFLVEVGAGPGVLLLIAADFMAQLPLE